MTHAKFTPEQPNGVLYDSDGRVVYRFGGFRPGTPIDLPEYIDPTRSPTYTDTETPGSKGHVLEAHVGSDSLPDPKPPDWATIDSVDVCDCFEIDGGAA